MTRTQYYVAASLDGFIADTEDGLDWLLSRRSERGGPPGYAAFIAATGAIAMGARTYRWILDHDAGAGDGVWPYEVPCWVFTHHELPVVPGATVLFTSEPVAAVHREMVRAAGGRNVWVVGGGDLAGQFSDAGLLDELVLAIAPVTLGAGAPLLPRRVELALEGVVRDGDFACARYAVVRAARCPDC